MNIKTRLEKLEGEILRDTNSDICTCPRETICDVLYPDLDKTDEDREREKAEWLKPVFCELCGKRIERQMIEIVWREGGPQRIDTIA